MLTAGTITQEQFLDQLKSHPLFEKERLTAEIEKEGQTGLLGVRDWNFSSSIFYTHEKPSFSALGPERTDAVAVSGGLEKMMWNSGARLLASFTSSYADLKISPMFDIPGSYFENKLAVTYVHPLIKNKSGFLDKLEYNLRQYDIDLSEIVAVENQENFLAEQTAKFLDWVFLLEQKKIVQQRLNLSEEMHENTREKRDANLIDEVDVIRSEDAVRIARQNLMLIEVNLNALQAELAELMQDENYNNLYPQHDLYEMTQLSSLEEANEQLKQNARLLKSLRIAIQKLNYVRKGYQGVKKPDLSAVAQLSLKNAEYNFGGSLAMDKPDALIGLELSYPIGYSSTKSKIARTNLRIVQLEKQIEEISLTLTSALANLHTQMTELKSVLKLNQEQIESSKRKTDEELKLYNQGRGQLTFVIQSRDSEQAAKLTYAANALRYQKLFLQYRALTDQLHD
jgi:hypothetical protein